jgi:hypothetical protein
VTAEVLSRAPRISEIAHALTGVQPRRSGPGCFRMPAVWRGGDGLNVALDDERGIWHDFTSDEGGGVLDLVARVRGGSRQDALKWLADFAGIPLQDSPLSPADRARFAEERKQAEADLPDARRFHRGVMCLCEEALDASKSRYFDPTEADPDYADVQAMQDVTRLLESLKRMADTQALQLYREWREQYPGMTAAIIRAVVSRQAMARRALLAYLRQTNPRRPAA